MWYNKLRSLFLSLPAGETTWPGETVLKAAEGGGKWRKVEEPGNMDTSADAVLEQETENPYQLRGSLCSEAEATSDLYRQENREV